MTRSAALSSSVLLALALMGCGGTNPGRGITDLRGDAIKPVDKTPPEGTMSPPAQTNPPFTLRRPAGAPARTDTVVRVDPPPRTATKPDPAASSPPRAVTTTPPTSSATSPSAATQAPAPATPAPSPTSSAKPPASAPPPSAPAQQFLAQDPPQVISRVAPVAPARAKEERIGGTVLVKVLVGTDGLVRSTRIARSIPELDSAAVACVKQWKFKPAMSSGVAVAAWLDVPVRFLLQ